MSQFDGRPPELKVSSARSTRQEDPMAHRRPLFVALTVGVLALAACGEDTTPTQPGAPVDQGVTSVVSATASNTWIAKARPPWTDLFLFTAGAAPNAAGQSVLYVFGGTTSDGGCSFHTQAYNVATNTWSTKASSFNGFNTNGVVKIGTRLYVSGGDSFCGGSPETTRATYAYDYTTDQFTRVADMPKATGGGVSGVLDGKLYVLPGYCSGEGYPFPGYCAQEPIRQLFRFDPVQNKWGARRAAPHYHYFGAGGAINGKLYVVGGRANAGAAATGALDVYDPATDSWRTLAPLPKTGRVVGTVLNNKLYVVVTATNQFYVYDPATNVWSAKAAYPTGFSPEASARVLLDGHTRFVVVDYARTEMYIP
jgi:N-acetylneuraminic acid mutarotase